MLEKSCRHGLQELISWQTKIQTNIQSIDQANRNSSVLHQAKIGALFIYQYSLLQLSMELVPWLLNPILNWAQQSILFEPENRSITIKFIGLNILGGCYFFDLVQMPFMIYATIMALLLTVPAHLLKSNCTTVSNFYQRYLPPPLKVLGFSLGLTYSYYLGFYELALMIGLSVTVSKLSQLLQFLSLNDARAALNFPIPSAINCIRFLSLSLTAFEIFLNGNYYRHLIPLVGGIIGSMITTTVGQKILPELQTKPNQQRTQDQVLVLFLLGVSGHNLGYSIMRLITAWYFAPTLQRFTCAQALNLFGLQNSASKNEMRIRRNELALKNHPDKCGDQCAIPMQDINDAYEALTLHC